MKKKVKILKTSLAEETYIFCCVVTELSMADMCNVQFVLVCECDVCGKLNDNLYMDPHSH